MLKLIFFAAFIIFTLSNLCSAKSFNLKWKPESKSLFYIIEISKEKSFKSLYKELKHKNNAIKLDLPLGTYYIRVCGVDKYDKKSKYTPVRKVVIRYNRYTRIVKEGDKYYTPKEFDLYFLLDQQKNKKLFYLLIQKDIFFDKTKADFKQYNYSNLIVDVNGVYSLYYYYIASDNSKSKINNIDLYIDSNAPKISFQIEEKIISGDFFRIERGKELVILAEDNESGIREILYSFDKKTFFHYDYPIIINQKKEFQIFVKVIDKVGNSTKLIKKNIQPF